MLLLGSVCSAAAENLGPTQVILAGRAEHPPKVDGRLDEPDWALAPLFDSFVQRFPKAGTASSERTELRVLYDNRYLYVGITCHDSQPWTINRNLGRRDAALDTDSVQVLLDTLHNHRTAYVFMLSAGGVQTDGLFYDDTQYTTEWDGVWEGATGMVEDGWVAEFAIPLSLLRFPHVSMQTWGFSVRRQVARLNEEVETVDNPRTSNAVVSKLGHLSGLEALEPRLGLRALPYMALRSIAHSREPMRTKPWSVDPSLDLGLDLHASLTSHLTLAATLNPDFGQVEADRLLLNLSNFEQFFPEKRPFFTQGLELFQPVGSSTGSVPHSLFYSRRIGLDTPIFGAVRLTGSLAPGVEVGVLDAVVAGPWKPEDASGSGREIRLHALRPLHLAPTDTLPSEKPVPMNYLAAVLRAETAPGLRLGSTVTAATPLTRTCTEEEALLDSAQSASCRARGGNAVAVDVDWRPGNGEYGVVGQMAGSQVMGGAPEQTLRDGTRLRRGDTGGGAYVRAGRLNGEGLRWDLGYDFSSPTLELNASGFQRTQNEQAARVNLHLLLAQEQNSLKSIFSDTAIISRWTTDGRGLHLGTGIYTGAGIQLPSFDTVGIELGTDRGGWTIREVANTGIPLQTTDTGYIAFFASSKPTRPLVLDLYLGVNLRFRESPASPSRLGGVSSLTARFQPHPTSETRLEVFSDYNPHGPRFIDALGDGSFLLGERTLRSLSVTLRQSWVIRPRLTLQAYGQFFSAAANYGALFRGVSDDVRRPISLADLERLEQEDIYSFNQSAFNLNLVLGWEYRLGSTLYVVYSRSQRPLPSEPSHSLWRDLLPSSLFRGPTEDALMLKLNWFLDA